MSVNHMSRLQLLTNERLPFRGVQCRQILKDRVMIDAKIVIFMFYVVTTYVGNSGQLRQAWQTGRPTIISVLVLLRLWQTNVSVWAELWLVNWVPSCSLIGQFRVTITHFVWRNQSWTVIGQLAPVLLSHWSIIHDRTSPATGSGISWNGKEGWTINSSINQFWLSNQRKHCNVCF